MCYLDITSIWSWKFVRIKFKYYDFHFWHVIWQLVLLKNFVWNKIKKYGFVFKFKPLDHKFAT